MSERNNFAPVAAVANCNATALALAYELWRMEAGAPTQETPEKAAERINLLARTLVAHLDTRHSTSQ
jgi:hypothetical protein